MSMFSQVSTSVVYDSRCARLLLSTLLQSPQKRRSSPSSPSPILLFALAASSATPPEVLSDITATLTQLYPEHVGCISAPLLHQHCGFMTPEGHHSCSLAYAFINGVSFRSTILGRAEAQVGRRHAARQRNNVEDGIRTWADVEARQMQTIDQFSQSQVSWERVWQRADNSITCSPSRYGNGLEMGALPDELKNLDPSAISSILYFSDKAPEGLARVLENAFPLANKLSLIASSTPFITGRPVTLFYNGSILSSGAVGVAFGSSPCSSPPEIELSFPPLVALSTNLNVTSSEGNMILSLDYGNPTKLLLTAIQKIGFSSSYAWVCKEDEFYVGVIDPPSYQVSQLYRINAGDPSRGSIALDAVSAPREGSIVRLYHLPSDAVPNAPAYIPDTISEKVSLFVAPGMAPAASLSGEIAGGHWQVANRNHLVVPNSFLAASENGFTLSHNAQGFWRCVIPGARAGLSWNRNE